MSRLRVAAAACCAIKLAHLFIKLQAQARDSGAPSRGRIWPLACRAGARVFCVCSRVLAGAANSVRPLAHCGGATAARGARLSWRRTCLTYAHNNQVDRRRPPSSSLIQAPGRASQVHLNLLGNNADEAARAPFVLAGRRRATRNPLPTGAGGKGGNCIQRTYRVASGPSAGRASLCVTQPSGRIHAAAAAKPDRGPARVRWRNQIRFGAAQPLSWAALDDRAGRSHGLGRLGNSIA